jgi:hypothetical protein
VKSHGINCAGSQQYFFQDKFSQNRLELGELIKLKNIQDPWYWFRVVGGGAAYSSCKMPFGKLPIKFIYLTRSNLLNDMLVPWLDVINFSVRSVLDLKKGILLKLG